ncbi:MAG TPA: nuclear transport factor 2 family protein [Microlunatus sp.]
MSAHLEDDIVALSRQKWQWMSQRQIEPLVKLFHDAAVFVHMGATMTKDAEIEVIRSGQIHYRDIDIQETSVRFIGGTAILLNKLQLVAVVGGNEVTNPFVVTEVYVQIDEDWKLASLSFTRLVTH